MLVTIGEHRFNLFNATRLDPQTNFLHFTDGTFETFSADEAAAVKAYWDGHAEQLTAKPKENAADDAGREFSLGDTGP